MAASRSPSKMKQRKAMETKKRLFCKRPKGCEVETGNAKKSMICYDRKENAAVDPYAFGKAKSSAIEQAKAVQGNLAPEFPSFIKPMLPSHVTGGFWLGLPKQFCDQHLPKHDDTVVLVDENAEASKTKYLVDKNGLSGGWRGFSIAHKLLEGDVLVFQLIEPCKFKVYIVRVNDLAEIDGAMVLLTLDHDAKPINIEGENCSKPLALNSNQDNVQEKEMVVLDTDCGPGADHSGDDSNDFGSEVLDGIRFSESVVDFKDVKTIDDFNIMVDGVIIDSEIPIHHRAKYYELCSCQKSFLHEHLLKDLNFKLVAGIISETVSIADAIRASNLTTSYDDFEIWDKTLKGFEALGMTVGFLRARLNRLLSLSCETEQVMVSKQLERIQAEEERKVLESKLSDVKEGIRVLGDDIEALQMKDKQREHFFWEEANAPW